MKKKKHADHVNHERWLVSYADFITLLFAFFVVMYAISQADLAKLKQVSDSMKQAFSAGPVGTIDLKGSSSGDTVNLFETQADPGGRVLNMPAGKTHTAADPDPKLQEIKELLEETISLELGVTSLSDQMQMIYDSRGLVVRLAVKGLFEVGSSEVKQDFQPLLDRIGRVLAKTKRVIRIEGHTEEAEAGLKTFPTDWELASARAAWVARFWIKRFKMDPRRIGVAGYAHYRPISKNDSLWGRASNRRVEIIVLNNEYLNDDESESAYPTYPKKEAHPPKPLSIDQ